MKKPTQTAPQEQTQYNGVNSNIFANANNALERQLLSTRSIPKLKNLAVVGGFFGLHCFYMKRKARGILHIVMTIFIIAALVCGFVVPTHSMLFEEYGFLPYIIEGIRNIGGFSILIEIILIVHEYHKYRMMIQLVQNPQSFQVVSGEQNNAIVQGQANSQPTYVAEKNIAPIPQISLISFYIPAIICAVIMGFSLIAINSDLHSGNQYSGLGTLLVSFSQLVQCALIGLLSYLFRLRKMEKISATHKVIYWIIVLILPIILFVWAFSILFTPRH